MQLILPFLFALHLPLKFQGMNLIDELRWRGMIQDIMPGTEEQLNKEMTTAYIGFDPTADSLHVRARSASRRCRGTGGRIPRHGG